MLGRRKAEKARLIAAEVEFYRSAYGDRALEKIRDEIERPDIRSRYRAVLSAAATHLEEMDQTATRAAP